MEKFDKKLRIGTSVAVYGPDGLKWYRIKEISEERLWIKVEGLGGSFQVKHVKAYADLTNGDLPKVMDDGTEIEVEHYKDDINEVVPKITEKEILEFLAREGVGAMVYLYDDSSEQQGKAEYLGHGSFMFRDSHKIYLDKVLTSARDFPEDFKIEPKIFKKTLQGYIYKNINYAEDAQEYGQVDLYIHEAIMVKDKSDYIPVRIEITELRPDPFLTQPEEPVEPAP